MMMRHLIHLSWLLLLAGCTVNRDSVVPQTGATPGTPTTPGTPPELQVRTVSGEWIAANGGAGGEGSFDTFKNFQYTLEVTKSNQKLDIAMASADLDVQFALFDPLGQRIRVSALSRSPVNSFTVNAGTYRVVACAARRAVGKFTLTVMGTNSDPTLIPSQLLQSNTQNWGLLGGGGQDRTFKNHFYTFEVTEDNFSVDLELESADTDVELVLYDPLGEKIASDFFNARYRFKIIAVKKGIYTVMAATDKRGSVGNYRLNVIGKVKALQRVESQVTTVKGSWPNKNTTDTYTVQLTPNASPLDIDLSSADTPARIELQTSDGKRIVYNALTSKSNYILRQDLPKGTYRILVSPSNLDGGGGNYSLSVNGQFTDFKKF